MIVRPRLTPNQAPVPINSTFYKHFRANDGHLYIYDREKNSRTLRVSILYTQKFSKGFNIVFSMKTQKLEILKI